MLAGAQGGRGRSLFFGSTIALLAVILVGLPLLVLLATRLSPAPLPEGVQVPSEGEIFGWVEDVYNFGIEAPVVDGGRVTAGPGGGVGRQSPVSTPVEPPTAWGACARSRNSLLRGGGPITASCSLSPYPLVSLSPYPLVPGWP